MPMKKKILIIDDDPAVFQVIKRTLELKEYLISISTDGEAGIKQIEENTPDLIILDLMLPKIPGEEICRKIKTNEKTESIPIVMLTGKSCDADKVIGRLIGANYYMTKPFDIYDLLKKIAELLRRDPSHPVINRSE